MVLPAVVFLRLSYDDLVRNKEQCNWSATLSRWCKSVMGITIRLLQT